MAGIERDTLVYPGPFLGLDTTREPADLGLAYATRANNVTFSNGLIEPRIPWAPLQYRVETAPPEWIDLDAPILCLCQLRKSRATNPVIIAKVRAADGVGANLWALKTRRAPALLAGPQGFNDWPGEFVLHNGWVYLLDGAERIWKTDGTSQGTHLAGIKTPPPGTADEPALIVLGYPAGNVGGLVNYKWSLYDSRTGVESNAVWVVSSSPLNVQGGVLFRFYPSLVPEYDGADTLRLYRSRIEIGGPHRLIAEYSVPESMFAFEDILAEDEITLSSVTTGPFAPQRNQPIERANLGAVLHGRLFYGRLDQPGRVYYSAVGGLDYGHPDDFLNVSGDEDEIVRGLVAIGDQLWVGKRNAIYSVAGNIHTATNATLATGAIPLDTEEVITKSRAKIGPANNNGNGFVLAGMPAVVYFPTDSGFFLFDGGDVRSVSRRIKRTWRDFKQQGNGFFTFADDPEHQILFVCNGWHVDWPTAPILAYHYGADDGSGTGRWSSFTGEGLPVVGGGPPRFAVTAITTPVARHSLDVINPSPMTHSQILIGTNVGYFYMADADLPGAYVGTWNWTSGRIPIEKGGRGKLMWVKALFARSSGRIPSGAGMDLSIAMDGDDSRRDGVSGLFATEQCVVPVRRYGRTVVIEIAGSTAWQEDWTPALGVSGLVINAAPTGQR